jgi:hypothetical protein
MENITAFLIYLIWCILFLNRFFFNKNNNYKWFNKSISFDANFYKFKIYNIALILMYIALGFKYLDFKLFFIHLTVFVLTTIKLNKNSQSPSIE